MSSHYESEMIKALQAKQAVEKKVQVEMTLFQQMLPALRAAVKAGGGADQILKKSETIAAMELVNATQSDKDEVRLKASVEILNRSLGKPVDRSINIYGDISKMNERDVDNQILHLLGKVGPRKVLTDTMDIPVKKKQKRKSRKAEAFVEPSRPAETTVEVIPSAEAGTTPESQD